MRYPPYMETDAGILHLSNSDLAAYNVELVRDYWEQHRDCQIKEIRRALGLHPRTIKRALNIIKSQQ